MKATELMIGNYFYSIGTNGEYILSRVTEIVRAKKDNGITGYMGVSYKDGVKNCWSCEQILSPIPLTEEWAIKMKDNKHKAPFPDWIKYVHEAQNWYYWTYNKEELTIN